MTQTSIPVPPTTGPPPECAWCGCNAVDELEIQPAKYTNRKAAGSTVKILKKAAVAVPVCAFHRDSLYVAPLPE